MRPSLARLAIDPAYRPVTVFDLRHPERYSFTAPMRLTGPFANSRILAMPANTPGLIEVGGGYHVLADDPEPTKSTATTGTALAHVTYAELACPVLGERPRGIDGQEGARGYGDEAQTPG